MLEKLAELENKVLALVSALQERSEEIGHLHQANEDLARQLKFTEEKISQMEEERAEWLGKVAAVDQREAEIRDRLKGIIERISRCESNYASAEPGATE